MVISNIHSTKITKLADFIDSCNELFNKWMTGDKSLPADYGYDSKKFQNGLPEPYLGNPNECSAVIININPGGVEPGFNDRTTILGIPPSSYYDFAKDFPYKLKKHCTRSSVCKTTDWWVYRNSWIESIVVNVTGKKTERFPFAMELCPWHSPEWKGWNDLKDYVGNWAMEPLKLAIKNSELPFALAVVGPKVYEELIKNCSFKEVEMWECIGGKLSTITAKPTKRQKGRFYTLLEKEGVYVLCTYYFGGNQAPSPEFRTSEKEICNDIKLKGIV